MSELLIVYTALSLAAIDMPDKWIPPFMPLRDYDLLWKVIGFGGLGTFQARWIVQWLHSERQGESKVPIAFWWLSLVGSLLELMYFLRQQDPVGVAGYMISGVPYTRNLMLVYRKRRLEAEARAAGFEVVPIPERDPRG
jgi:lipid-A-disaccharide synthase-like uncharacterized protein